MSWGKGIFALGLEGLPGRTPFFPACYWPLGCSMTHVTVQAFTQEILLSEVAMNKEKRPFSLPYSLPLTR